MKKILRLIFGLIILGSASFDSCAYPYYDSDRDYDSRRYYDDGDVRDSRRYDRDYDFHRYYDSNGNYSSGKFSNDLDVYIRSKREEEERKRLEEQRELEELRRVKEQKRLEEEAIMRENQRKLEEYQAAEERRKREAEAIMQEKLRMLEEQEAAQKRKFIEEQTNELEELRMIKRQRAAEEMKQKEELGKKFEMFLKSLDQTGKALTPEQLKERKIQQHNVIDTLTKNIQNELARRSGEIEREQEKINLIAPQQWSDKEKVEFLNDQLTKFFESLNDLIRNLQGHGISNDPNLEFIPKSFEFFFKGIENLLSNGIYDDDRTLTNEENGDYRKKKLSQDFGKEVFSVPYKGQSNSRMLGKESFVPRQTQYGTVRRGTSFIR